MRLSSVAWIVLACLGSRCLALEPIDPDAPDLSVGVSERAIFETELEARDESRRAQTRLLRVRTDKEVDVLKNLRLPNFGVVVDDVSCNGAFAAAGLKTCDVIYAVNGSKVATTDELRQHLAKLKVGDRCHFDVQRGSTNDGKQAFVIWRPTKVAATVQSLAESARAATKTLTDDVERVTYYVHPDVFQENFGGETHLTACVMQHGEQALPRFFLMLWVPNDRAPNGDGFILRADDLRLTAVAEGKLPDMIAQDIVQQCYDKEVVQLEDIDAILSAQKVVVRYYTTAGTSDYEVEPRTLQEIAAIFKMQRVLLAERN